MADAIVPYDAMLKEYPEHVALLVEKLRKSKSIHKHVEPQLLDWCYSWGYVVDGSNFKGKTLKDYLKYQQSKTLVTVAAKIGRWYAAIRKEDNLREVDPLPEPIAAIYRKQWKSSKTAILREANNA